MNKVVLMMWRRPELTRDEYMQHYLEVHSALALRCVTQLHGYTVNVPDLSPTASPPDGPDSVIEIWTRDPNALFDPARGFTSHDDFEAVMRDDASFIGTTAIWEVEPGTPSTPAPDVPMRSRTPGVKRVTLVAPGAALPSNTLRSAVDRVVAARTPRRPPPKQYDVAAFVYEWAEQADDLAPVSGPSFLLSEYRQRIPPTD